MPRIDKNTREYKLKLYSTKRWRMMRAAHLKANPYCQCPIHEGQKVKGEVVDHIVPHRGDTRLFFKHSNLQTMTATCHNSFKQSQERGGIGFGCDANGEPRDKGDRWYGTESSSRL